MKHLLLASLITLLAIGTSCGQASEPEPVASDGIQLHGHWTVTVTNPDGTVDAVHEFDNELASAGADLLTLLLSDQNPGPLIWHIIPSDSELTTRSEDLKCVETILTLAGGGLGDTHHLLAIQDRDSSLNGSPLRLTASCTVAELPEGQSKNLQYVTTNVFLGKTGYPGFSLFDDGNGEWFYSCNKSWPEVDHLDGKCQGLFLTNHSLSPSIPIANGQLLSFNVVISFS